MEIKKIASKDNEKIKFLRKLKQKKYREEYGRFMVENLTIINDAAKAGYYPEYLFVSENLLRKKEADDIIKKNKLRSCYIINEKINIVFSDLDTPSGICAVYKKENKEITYQGGIIYLNAISDPGNLDTILRSALAFGIRDVVVDEHCVDVYNFKTINAAKDTIFKLNIEKDTELKKLKEIKEKMKIFSTRMNNADGPEKLRKKKSFCVVFGNEANGVDQKIQNISDDFIKIEMNGEIESLNVACAAAIILYVAKIN